MVCASLSGSEGVTLIDGGAAVDSGRQRIKEGRIVGEGVRSDQKYLKMQSHLALAHAYTHTHLLSRLLNMPLISPCTCRVAAAWSVCGDPSLFMLLPTHITTAPQSNAVTLWRVTVRVTSMKLVGVASVIRVWSPMVYEAVTPDSWMLRVVSGKPRARQVKVTLSPAAAVT